MADKISQEKTLKLDAGFYDGDNRLLPIDNPKTPVNAAAIKAFATTIKNTAAIVGDKGSAAFVGFNSAKIVNKKTTQFDLR